MTVNAAVTDEMLERLSRQWDHIVAENDERVAKRRRTAMEPAEFQESHSPTEWVDVLWRRHVDPETGEVVEVHVHNARRRAAEARFWNRLSDPGQAAAEALARGFWGMVGALYIRPVSVEMRAGRATGSAMAEGTVFVRDYREWTRRYASPAPVVNVVCLAESCTATDRKFRRRNGWASDVVLKGLDEYCRMKGWPGAVRPRHDDA